MELSFEYLMSKSCLKWITIASEQAMLMFVCLQNMVDELLNKKDGNDFNNMQVTLHFYEAEMKLGSNFGEINFSESGGGVWRDWEKFRFLHRHNLGHAIQLPKPREPESSVVVFKYIITGILST